MKTIRYRRVTLKIKYLTYETDCFFIIDVLYG